MNSFACGKKQLIVPEKFVETACKVHFQLENVHFQAGNMHFQVKNIYFQAGNEDCCGFRLLLGQTLRLFPGLWPDFPRNFQQIMFIQTIKQQKIMRRLFRLAGFGLALGMAGLLGLSACSDEDTLPAEKLDFVLDTDAGSGSPILLVSEETYTLTYQGKGVEDITVENEAAGWQVVVDEAGSRIVLTAPAATADTEPSYTLQLTVAGTGGQSLTTEGIDFHRVTFDDPKGTFVLNEGNMTTENGSLVYITPEGYVLDNAYKRVNGTELGNVAQDMYFHDGKVYLISQNGDTNAVGTSFENDGMLVVADAATLKKVRSFTNAELDRLDWPTHVAVLDEQHVYIRDNAGIWRLNMDDASLTFVEGSEGAPKARLAVVDGAVYFPLNGLLAGLKKIDPSGDQVSGVANMAFWMASPMINRFLGVAASDDGNLWVMGTSATDGGSEGTLSLGKLDLAANKLTQNLLGTQPDEAYDCCFAAHGNTIYYANGTTLYRVLFDPEAGTDEFREEPLVDLASLDDNVGLLYNGLGVSPATGHVYANTLKGFGNAFTTNTIWEFDFDASLDTPVHRFDDHTRFPAGVYFCK